MAYLQKLQTIGEDFCGLDVNTPLGGETPMTAVPVLLVNQHLTAVAATSTGDYTVVFLGTNNGRLKKVCASYWGLGSSCLCGTHLGLPVSTLVHASTKLLVSKY